MSISAQDQIDRPRDTGQPSVWVQTTAGAQDDQGYVTRASPTSQGTYWSTSTPRYISQQHPTTNFSPGYRNGYTQSHNTSHSTYQTTRPRRTNVRALPRGQGAYIEGDYIPGQNLHYSAIDVSFYVRSRSFFTVGRVFAVMWNETASETANVTVPPVDYTTSSVINRVRYRDNFVYTNVRRFVVVKAKTEFCFACPIFTYSNRGTTKRGVRPEEHAIVFTSGYEPQLVQGETGITKPSISVVQEEGSPPLNIASRIYFGIHHPVQYNVRVKDIGHVPQEQVSTLVGIWREEDDKDSGQSQDVTDNAERPELDPVYEEQPAQGAHGAYDRYVYSSQ